jgi:hypothetical protein
MRLLELLYVSGMEIVEPLPSEIQALTVFTVGLSDTLGGTLTIVISSEVRVERKLPLDGVEVTQDVDVEHPSTS